MSTFDEYVGRLRSGDCDLLLGELVTYIVSECNVKHETLVLLLAQAGLTAFLPSIPSDVDVFRRVCTASQRKRQASSVAGVFENFLIRDVGSDGKTLSKRIVKETVDAAGRRLAYEQMCDVDFRREDSAIIINCRVADVASQEIGDEIIRRFAAEVGTVNAYGLRELIRRVLISSNAYNVRGSGGGLYFVGHDHVDRVRALEGLAKNLPTVIVHAFPLIDDSKQREFLKQAYEEETSGEINSMIAEINQAAGAGEKWSTAKVQTIVDRYGELVSRHAEHTELLETELGASTGQLRLFKSSMMKLMSLQKD